MKKRLLSSIYQKKRRSLNLKNKKLKGLASKNKIIDSNYSTPLINVCYIELTSNEINQFKLGLEYIFIDKNKNINENLAANVEPLVDKVTDNIRNCKCVLLYP